MTEKNEEIIVNEDEIVLNPDFDELLPPNNHGFLLNKHNCVIMSLDTLIYEVANEELKNNLLNDENLQFYLQQESEDGKND